MWMTKVSPWAVAGEPEELWSIPEASIATWPSGLVMTLKMVAGSAGMVRWTSKRSLIGPSCTLLPAVADHRAPTGVVLDRRATSARAPHDHGDEEAEGTDDHQDHPGVVDVEAL